MWMNQADIMDLHQNLNSHSCPNVRKGVRLLYRLMEAVNDQSDGWPYWKAPSQAAEKLMELLRGCGNIWYPLHGSITEAQLKEAITPIKRMVTTQRKKQAQYGNTFNFDVDAALRN